jgi:predicted nucleic acid-binding protein
MLTLDTSGLLALFDRKDPFHSACVAAVDTGTGPLFVSTAVLAEIAWLLEARFPPHVEDAVIEDMRTGAYTLDWHEQDLSRVQHLIRKYRDLPLGLADAAVVACAERHGGRVLTTDFRHFPVVARGERTIQLAPGYES